MTTEIIDTNSQPLLTKMQGDQVDRSQNVTFMNTDVRTDIDITQRLGTTYGTGALSDSKISEFLDRPVRLLDITYNVGSEVVQTFDPWTLFLDNPVVRKK